MLIKRIFVLLLLCVIVIYFFQSIIIINISKSLPLGVYLKSNEIPHKGDIIAICPPDITIFREARKRRFIDYGLCPGNYGMIIKILAAEVGDHITVNMSGIFVNKRKFHGSEPVDMKVHMEMIDNYTLENDEIIIVGEHPLSFDSRYFGVLDRSQICSKLIPFIVWR